MTGLLLLLVIGAALHWLGCVFGVAWMLTHPPRRTYTAAVARGRPGDPGELHPARQFDEWTFRSRSRDLPVWEVAGDLPAGGPTFFAGTSACALPGPRRADTRAPFFSGLGWATGWTSASLAFSRCGASAGGGGMVLGRADGRAEGRLGLFGDVMRRPP